MFRMISKKKNGYEAFWKWQMVPHVEALDRNLKLGSGNWFPWHSSASLWYGYITNLSWIASRSEICTHKSTRFLLAFFFPLLRCPLRCNLVPRIWTGICNPNLAPDGPHKSLCIFNDMVILFTCFELPLTMKSIPKNHITYFWWLSHKIQKSGMFSLEQSYVRGPLEIFLIIICVNTNYAKNISSEFEISSYPPPIKFF